MLKSIKSNYLPARPYNRHTSVVDLSTDFSAGNILKRNNKMSKKPLNKQELINKIKSLNKIYVKNESLKMYEACKKNMELIFKYENDLKEYNN